MNAQRDKTSRDAEGPVLEVRGLSVDFAVDDEWVPAATGLDYSLAPGKVLAIVGESGSGKSASSMAILGLLPRNSRVRGSAKLLGRELVGLRGDKLREVRGKDLAVIFQEPMTALNPVYTIGAQIVETLRVHFGMTPRLAKERALEMLALVELPDPEKAFASYPHQLSGGQRQRAMIAQSISCDPKLLIADEPTTALDVTVQAEILDLMRSLRDRLGSAILLITHDMGVVADIADDIAVMRRGEIVERGTVTEVFARPKHPYTQQLLDAVHRLGEREDGAAVDIVAPLAKLVDEVEQMRIATVERRPAAEGAVADAVPALSFSNVVIEYPGQRRVKGFRAIDDLTLEVRDGEILGLVGESGSGKSTLGRAAIGLLPITSGRLQVTGVDISSGDRAKIRSVHRKVGVVFQDPSSSLNPRMPIGQSIGEPLLLAKKQRGKGLDRAVEDLLDAVQLPRAYKNRYPHELSGGQKQRVGIARALSLRPELLIADEPTSALDVSVQAKVLELLRELQAEFSFACLFVSHDLAVIDALADRIAVLRKGELVEAGTRDKILRAPQQKYTQRLIAAVPVPDPAIQAERRALRTQLLAGD